MEQESDVVTAVVEDETPGTSSGVDAEETPTSRPETVTAVTGNDDDRNATEQGGEDREVAVARSDKRKKSYRPSLEVVEVKVDFFYNKAVFKRGLQVETTRIQCLTPVRTVEATVGLANGARN